MYTGNRVRLREYRKEDAQRAKSYINDPEVKRLLDSSVPSLKTLHDEERWIADISESKDQYHFAIETLAEEKYIGGCGINSIDWKNSVALVGIFIGDRNYWGKGYGTDAMGILVRFIFEQMNLHKIKLTVFSFNERAIKSYEKLGFQREGALRQELFRDGQYHDIHIMGLLREEYYQGKGI